MPSAEAPMRSRPGGPAASDGLDRALLAIGGVVILGAIMSILDVTVVNVAINKLALAFSSPLSTIQWIATGYTLALATVIPLSGWASDRFGAKNVYLVAVVLFVLGSAMTGLAWSTGSLITFRVLQGFGGGMIMPAGMTILTRAAGPHRLGRIMSVIGIPMLLGPIVGPILGGWLVDQVSWRWIFYINVPIGIAAFVSALFVLPRERPEGRARLDLLGVILLSPGLAAFIYGLAQSASAGGVRDVHAWGPALAGIVLIGLFVWHALRTRREALLDLRLFADRIVGATGVTLVVYVVGVMGGMLLLPLYFQIVRGESAFWSGLLLAPQGIGAMLAMQLGGRLVDRIGPGRVIVPGVVLSVVGFAVFAVVGATTPFWLLCGELFISGVGLGMVLMPTFTAVMQNVQPAAIARASTALNIIQQGATSIGTALFSIVLTSQLAAHFGNAGNGGALAAARAVPAGLRAQLAPVIAAGFAHTFVWTLVLVGVTFFSALLLLRGRARSQMAPSAEAVDEEPAA